MWEKYKIVIQQNAYKSKSGEIVNEYHFSTETGIYLGGLKFPGNLQLMFDEKMLEIICKALAVRWGLIKRKADN